MFNQIHTAFVIAAVAIGCAMLPVTGHDPTGGKLAGRSPFSAVNDVLRSREQRRAGAQCFATLTRAAILMQQDDCNDGGVIRV